MMWRQVRTGLAAAVTLVVVLVSAPNEAQAAVAVAGAGAAPDAPGLLQDGQPERRRRRPGGGRRGGSGGSGDSMPEKAGGDAEAAGDGDAAKAEDDDLPKLEHDWLAIKGGIVHTVSGSVYPGATILCKDGKISAIGRRVRIPEDAEVIDATGQHVYPGLVAVQSGGVLGGGNPASTTDVFSFNMTLGLAAGITTAMSGTTAAKLTFGSLEGHVIAGRLYENLRYDSNAPRQRRQVRRDMERVRAYLRDKATYDRTKSSDPDAKEPDASFIRGNFATYRRLIEGDAVARVRAEDAHGILQICDLAEHFGIDVVIEGATEGWTVADRMGRAGIDVILRPRTDRPPNEGVNRPTGSSIQNAAILREHGVRVAVLPAGGLFGPGERISLGGLAGRDLQHLPMAAAFAVRGGLSNREGIGAITLDAARILGIDDRVGSIEIGKDADFAITDGDLLHYMTLVQTTIVNGRVVYEKAEDTLFSHIRPLDDPDRMPEDYYWPRKLGDGP